MHGASADNIGYGAHDFKQNRCGETCRAHLARSRKEAARSAVLRLLAHGRAPVARGAQCVGDEYPQPVG